MGSKTESYPLFVIASLLRKFVSEREKTTECWFEKEGRVKEGSVFSLSFILGHLDLLKVSRKGSC